ncbi:protein kinase domain-containing protein [Microtetraspora malaysiensis]|uniref:protein kinase domain-containing protein n=1 Tax=Microtetraspora malaysiensis TaxID=161358 RepID=UPI003D8AEA8F
MTGTLLPEDPERLGEYWLAGRLGAGGQGVVYEAYDGQGHRVAIKVLHGDAVGDPELKRRLGREAAAARRVASFCTARVIAADLDGPKPHIVSEYVEGPSLHRAVQEGRVFGEGELHRLATAIATALTAVHEAGVIHRDLKPDNVLLGPDGPRVIDFGIARTPDMSLTSTGLVAGTPTYMAPEVFTGQRAGAAADVFAWGGIMVFAATGEDPFKAESLGGVMHRVLSVDPDLSALPAPLRPLVGAALAKEPRTRPAARDLLMALINGGGLDDTGRLLAEGSRAAGTVEAAADDPALGTLAEEAYGMLGQTERDLVPELFLRMVAVAPDGELATRRMSEDEAPPGAEGVLRAFAYVLSLRDDEISLSRPAVLWAWPRLRAWVAAERDGLAVHGEIRGQARHWAGHGRRDGDLLQGSRLDAAVGWAATGRRHLTLNALERDFLDASTALTRRRAGRRRLLTLALAVLLVLSLAGGGLAVYQGGRIADQRDKISEQLGRANGREVAFRAGTLRTTDPTTAMLLSVAGWRLDGGPESRSGLMSALYQPETAAFREPPLKEQPVRALTRDGRRLVSVSTDEIRVYDVRTGRQIRRFNAPGMKGSYFWQADVSPSGRLLAVVTYGKALVWDLEAGRSRGELKIPGAMINGGVAFGDDESKIALKEDSNAFVWDYATGATYGRALEGGWESSLPPTVSRSGRLATVIDPEGRLDVRRLPKGAADPRFRKACPRTTEVAAFSPDGGVLACAGWEIALVSTRTGERRPLGEDASSFWPWTENNANELARASSSGLRFSADGRLLAGFADRSIRVWQVSDQRQIFKYRADGEVSDVRLDPDGRTLRYLLDDSVVSLDLRPQVRTTSLPGGAFKTGLSPDGRWMSAERPDSTPIRIWDLRRRRFTGSLPGTTDSGVPAVFDAAGRTMVTEMGLDTGHGQLQAWDVASRAPLWRFRLPADYSLGGSAFSPDGKIFAASIDGISEADRPRLLLWDARSGRLIRRFGLTQYTGVMAFTRDGRTLVTGTGRLIDVASGAQVGTSFTPSPALAVSPTRDLLAVGGLTGRISLWDTKQASPGPVLHGAAEGIDSVAFSPAEDVLATVGESGTVQLWDVRARRRLGAPVTLSADAGLTLTFDSDGSRIHVADQSGHLFELPVTADLVAQAVCARAGRTLTKREWRNHLPEVPYRNVCPR